MAKSYREKLKEWRKNERDMDKLIHKAAFLNNDATYLVAVAAVKKVFKDRATTNKLSELVVEMQRVFDKLTSQEWTETQLNESNRAETGIYIDLKTHHIYNTRKKVKDEVHRQTD